MTEKFGVRLCDKPSIASALTPRQVERIVSVHRAQMQRFGYEAA
jgi:hypothetical protein